MPRYQVLMRQHLTRTIDKEVDAESKEQAAEIAEESTTHSDFADNEYEPRSIEVVEVDPA